jgi:hypothetical protein
MVPHPLDVLGDEMQVHAGPDGAGVLHHMGQELAEDRVVHLVHVPVPRPHILGQLHVAADIGVQRVGQHLHHRFASRRIEPEAPGTGVICASTAVRFARFFA